MDPSVTGMITTEESVKKQLKVIHDLDEKTSGMFLSQNGNHDWQVPRDTIYTCETYYIMFDIMQDKS